MTGTGTALTPERVLRRLEWRVLRRLDGRLQGDYRTVFRGTGIDVADLREYQFGDDLRHVDWNVTARTDVTARPGVPGGPRGHGVAAARQLGRRWTSGPSNGASTSCSPRSPRTVAQLLSRGGNRVGAVLFDSGVRETIPPGHGRNQVLRILARLMRADAGRRPPGGRRPGPPTWRRRCAPRSASCGAAPSS